MIPVVFVKDIHDRAQLKPFIDYIAQMQFTSIQILPFVDEPARRKLTRFVEHLVDENKLDSKFDDFQKWKWDDWRTRGGCMVKNAEIIKECIELMRGRDIIFVKVKSK